MREGIAAGNLRIATTVANASGLVVWAGTVASWLVSRWAGESENRNLSGALARTVIVCSAYRSLLRKLEAECGRPGLRSACLARCAVSQVKCSNSRAGKTQGVLAGRGAPLSASPPITRGGGSSGVPRDRGEVAGTVEQPAAEWQAKLPSSETREKTRGRQAEKECSIAGRPFQRVS